MKQSHYAPDEEVSSFILLSVYAVYSKSCVVQLTKENIEKISLHVVVVIFKAGVIWELTPY